MWKIVIAIVVVLAALACLFFGDLMFALSGGRLQLDPSISPSVFAAGLFVGLALIIYVFYLLFYEMLLAKPRLHPKHSAGWALILTVALCLVWMFADFAVYYFWLNPRPAADSALLGGPAYPFFLPAAAAAACALFGALFWRYGRS